MEPDHRELTERWLETGFSPRLDIKKTGQQLTVRWHNWFCFTGSNSIRFDSINFDPRKSKAKPSKTIVEWGAWYASLRSGILILVRKARRWFKGRFTLVDPEDIQPFGLPGAFRHRLSLHFRAEAEQFTPTWLSPIILEAGISIHESQVNLGNYPTQQPWKLGAKIISEQLSMAFIWGKRLG